jgi:Zn-dependent metalloprotease
MLKRQFSLLAIATLLLSPTLVHADEIGESTNISVSNMQIQTDTPTVNITTAQPFAHRWLISSRKRRMRKSVRKPVANNGQMIYTPTVKSQPTISQPPIAQPPIAQPQSDSTNRSVVQQTSTIRSSSHTSNNGSHSEQQSSVQCSSSGSGTSVTRSTQTINGKTVSSEVRTNCP